MHVNTAISRLLKVKLRNSKKFKWEKWKKGNIPGESNGILTRINNIQMVTKSIHAVHKSVQMKKRTETDPVWNHQKTMTKTEPISLMHLQRTSKARILFTKKQLMIKIIKERDLTVRNWQKTADKGIGKVETNQLPRIIAKAIKRHSANGANTI